MSKTLDEEIRLYTHQIQDQIDKLNLKRADLKQKIDVYDKDQNSLYLQHTMLNYCDQLQYPGNFHNYSDSLIKQINSEIARLNKEYKSSINEITRLSNEYMKKRSDFANERDKLKQKIQQSTI